MSSTESSAHVVPGERGRHTDRFLRTVHFRRIRSRRFRSF